MRAYITGLAVTTIILSMKKSLPLALFIFLMALAAPLAAQKANLTQERCATHLLHNHDHDKHERFEGWLEKVIEKRRQLRAAGRLQEQVHTIPVVVHVIHSGQPIGQGSNITDEQVRSQIDVLNQDFRRLNADANQTRAEFQGVAADIGIEFALAVQDPEGLPTTGIQRARGDQSQWNPAEQVVMKSLSYWPSDQYLNIWVADLPGQLLGYAQFPVSNLPGLEDSPNTATTDGVVIDYQFFGNQGNIINNTSGRTTTHEVGHYLGLRHIWGDASSCEVDDFVADTPPTNSPHYGCNLDRAVCGSLNMVQNYMDYSDDACMNLFTQDQKERMRAVLENSTRRVSLLTSPALDPPVQVNNDLGVRQILSPGTGLCEDTFTPTIEVRNYGSNIVNSYTVQLLVNGNPVESISQNTTLDYLDTRIINFTPINNIQGQAALEFRVTQVNGGADGNSRNNSRTIDMVVFEQATPEVTNNGSLNNGWTLRNPDELDTWQLVQANSENGTAFTMNYYDYDIVGEYDYLLSPSIDFSGLLSANVVFDVAYRPFPGIDADGLIVAISTDCGNTFNPIDYVYRKTSTDLATGPEDSAPFTPTSANDWRRERVNLNRYIDDGPIVIAFIGQNGFGNNIYLDNIAFEVQEQFGNDLAITNILQPSFISCNTTVNPVIEVTNLGTNTMNSFTLEETVSGTSFTYTGAPLASRESTIVEMPSIEAANAENIQLNFTVAPNGPAFVDENSNNNTVATNVLVNNAQDIIPLRERFEPPTGAGGWSVINPDGQNTWELTTNTGLFNNRQSFTIDNFNNADTGDEDWLISPVLDFSQAPEAVLTFDLAYQSRPNTNDTLEIRVSTNCGQTFDDLIFLQSGQLLSQNASTDEFFTPTSQDFRNLTFNLNNYAAQGFDQLRLAFVNRSGRGNRLYIDNLLISVQELPLLNVERPFNNFKLVPSHTTGPFEAIMNLEERQDITVVITNALGQVVQEKTYTNVIDQVYSFDLSTQKPGMYLFRVFGNSYNQGRRIIIVR